MTRPDADLHASHPGGDRSLVDAEGARAGGVAPSREVRTIGIESAGARRSRSAQPAEVLLFWRKLYSLTPRVFVTYALVGLNVAVFGLMALRGVSPMNPTSQQLLDWGANYADLTLSGQWWRLATSMWLHVGLLHLGVNMWALWILGPVAERLVGNVGFLLVYVLSGLAGGLASIAFNPGPVSAGASGALFGIMGAIVGFVILRRDSIPRPIFVGVLQNSVICIGLNVVIGLSVAFIDNAAHMGGLAAGVIGGLVLSQRLEPDARARRRWRNLLLAALGGSALAAWATLLSQREHASDDPLNRVDRLLTQYNETVEQYQQKRIEPEEFAAVLESDLLPEWRRTRKELTAQLLSEAIPDHAARRLQAVVTAMQHYEDGFRLLAERLRDGGAGDDLEWQRKLQAGDDVLRLNRD